MINPYAPPKVEAEHNWTAPRGDQFELARLGQRLWGAVVDVLLLYLVLVPVGFVIGFMAKNSANGTGIWFAIAVALVSVVPFSGYQLYLVAQGQSLGKRVAKTRVVRLDGSAPGFVHGVLLRNILFLFVSAVPVVGSLASLVDVAMIFQFDRRTLRDHIAGTRVIQS